MGEPYAHWGRRVGAYFIDGALLAPFYAVAMIGFLLIFSGSTTDPVTNQVTLGSSAPAGFAVAGVAGLAMIVFGFWNQVFRQGRRGASLGKQWLNLMVVSENDGRPIGALLTFVRQLVHILDSLACYVGWLWPLWDAKRQTFADKIMSTVVLHLPPVA
jgi:uncharacterized RDD family membrane protein YckC